MLFIATFCCVFFLQISSLDLSAVETPKVVCSNEIIKLSVLPYSSVILMISEQNINTVFVANVGNRNMSFYCSGTAKQISNGSFELTVESNKFGNSDEFVASGVLNSHYLVYRNQVNKQNVSIACLLKTNNFGQSAEVVSMCRVNLVAIDAEATSCEVTNSLLLCPVGDWTDQASPVKDNSLQNKINSPFVPTYEYSFFFKANATWVTCSKYTLDGNVTTDIAEISGQTETIKCPISAHEVLSPIIVIRLEKTVRTVAAVGLPIFGVGQDRTDYTYFQIHINSTLNIDSFFSDKGSSVLYMISFGIGSSVVLLILLLIVVKYSCASQKGKILSGSKPSRFLLAIDGGLNPDCKKVSSKWYVADKDSIDTTSTYNSSTMEKNSASLLKDQLHGDSSKLNPFIALNFQVQALSYKLSYEINRSSFEMGQLLGSGNYGRVYKGKAWNIFHMGSVDTVAIKTVNNSLITDQISALLYEIKILANLDLHLNLVNMLAACTSLLHEGKLWLMIEFCPHRDLKSFLVSHRHEYLRNYNSSESNDFNCRIFLKWAHSISCGMLYLSSKRIMHGDLAARNILLGDSYVAKISDFGLSKPMYSNVSYKKRDRTFIPWKYMAVEFFVNGNLCMKSDNWSYGIVLWEIFSLGEEPYANAKQEIMVPQIMNGYTLSQPWLMQELFWAKSLFNDLVKRCWEYDQENRISFADIVSHLTELLNEDEVTEYLNFTKEYELKNCAINGKSFTEQADSYHKLYSIVPNKVDSYPSVVVKPSTSEQSSVDHEDSVCEASSKDPETVIAPCCRDEYITFATANRMATYIS